MADNKYEKFDAYIKEKNYIIKLFPSENSKQFTAFSELYEFVKKEIEYWKPIDEDICQRFYKVQNYLNGADSIAHHPQGWENHIVNAISELNNPCPSRWDGQRTLPTNISEIKIFSETQEAKFLKQIREENPEYYFGAKLLAVKQRCCIHPNVPYTSSDFAGIISAYNRFYLSSTLKNKIKSAEENYGDVVAKTAEEIKNFENYFSQFKTDKEKEFNAFKENNDKELQNIKNKNQDLITYYHSEIKKLENT